MPRRRKSEPRNLGLGALGQAIESFIQERRLTQEMVANEADLDVKQISSFVRGQGNPTYDTLLKLCNGLHVRLSELQIRAEELLDERLRVDARQRPV